jgi:hypothetical protein
MKGVRQTEGPKTKTNKTICYSGIGSKKSMSHSSTEFAKLMDVYIDKYGCGGPCPTTEAGLINLAGAMRVSKERCDEVKRTNSKNKKLAKAADSALLAFKQCAREKCGKVTANQADQYTNIDDKVNKSAEIMAACSAMRCNRESSKLIIKSSPKVVKSKPKVVKSKPKVVKSKPQAVKPKPKVGKSKPLKRL